MSLVTYLLFLAGAGALIGWLLVLAGILITTWPRAAPAGPATDALGAESPAVVNLLTHRCRCTSDAIRATLVDLASREILEFRGLGSESDPVLIVIKDPDPPHLTQYERRLLGRLRWLAQTPLPDEHAERNHGGNGSGVRAEVVPLARLDFGSHRSAVRWLRRFQADVAADARAHRLARAGVSTDFLVGAALLPALLLTGWTYLKMSDDQLISALAVFLAVFLSLLQLSNLARDRRRATAAGVATAGQWLGYAHHLQEHRPDLARATLGSTPTPSRILGYAVALGLAVAISEQLPVERRKELPPPDIGPPQPRSSMPSNV
ncbi:MAG: DUF2207 family protein [Micromonosporaceae bacterium]